MSSLEKLGKGTPFSSGSSGSSVKASDHSNSTQAESSTDPAEIERRRKSQALEGVTHRRTRASSDKNYLYLLDLSGHVTGQNETDTFLTEGKPKVTSTIESIEDTSARENTTPAIDTDMSQRNRAPRNTGRGDQSDGLDAQALWDEIKRRSAAIKQGEMEAAQVFEKIVATEKLLKAKEGTAEGLTIAEIDAASELFRESMKMVDVQKIRVTGDGMITKTELVRDITKNKEKELENANDDGSTAGRASSSRTSGMEFDGPSDSTVPSPADNKQIRKTGASRTNSQPPRGVGDKEISPTEASDRTNKPKIVYHQGQEVCFRRKIPGKNDEHDWIQGRVVRVIGEGKSRRYEINDPYPDEVSAGNTVYKSSASQMVPVPPQGAVLADYEVGRTVLALYPDTTTYYRAVVKGMLDGGKKVQLQFEGETPSQLQEQWRRFVLDHKI